MIDIPFIVHEAELERADRHNKRLFALCIIMFLAMVMTNVGWLIHETMFEDVVTETIESTSETGNAYGVIVSGKNSEAYYGESQSDQNQDTQTQNRR